MRRSAFLVALLLLAVMGRSHAAPAPATLSAQDKEAICAVIQRLHQAYEKRDLEAVMALEQEAVDSKAAQVEASGIVEDGRKLTAAAYKDAIRGCTEEILNHKDYKLRELELQDLAFKRVGDRVEVCGVVPIIATDRVEVVAPGSGMMASLTYNRFTFEKRADGWHIVGMDL